ncbi:MAG: hypothetical protein LBT82_04380 [Oscillospiraceae bacterium]|jgi:chromosome segregation ATPase|nr:hypothetical protein [Oscillospiraceae bacterium]
MENIKNEKKLSRISNGGQLSFKALSLISAIVFLGTSGFANLYTSFKGSSKVEKASLGAKTKKVSKNEENPISLTPEKDLTKIENEKVQLNSEFKKVKAQKLKNKKDFEIHHPTSVNELQRLNTKIKDQENEINSLKKENKTLKLKLKKSNKEKETLKEEVSKFKEKCKKLTDENIKLDAACVELKKKYQQFQVFENKYKNYSEKLVNQNNQLKSQLKQLVKKKEQYRQKTVQLQNEKTDLQQNNKILVGQQNKKVLIQEYIENLNFVNNLNSEMIDNFKGFLAWFSANYSEVYEASFGEYTAFAQNLVKDEETGLEIQQ